jgi:hypothetical protein
MMDPFQKTSPARGPRTRRRLARSLSTAAVASLIVVAVAFSAALAAEPGDGTVDPYPNAVPIDLAATFEDGHVNLLWSICDTNGFRHYSIVRSTDGVPSWPVGGGDTVVADIDDIDVTEFVDANPPAGAVVSYRVFAIADPFDVMDVVCQSPIRSVTTPAAPPTATPDPTPTPDATPTPTTNPTPTPTPDPTPKPHALGLSLSIRDGKPYVDWSRCSGRYDYYKVVRSTNATVTWPMGNGDSLVAAVRRGDTTAVRDTRATAGSKVWYRVFCVRATNAGYKSVASTAAKSIQVPARHKRWQ